MDGTVVWAADETLRLDTGFSDYLIILIYFGFVLGIGILAKRQVSSSIDFFLSGRSLPAWVTGLAFISANLGAVEIMGMSANGAQYGLPTMHYFWIGAVPAMLFLGGVMGALYTLLADRGPFEPADRSAASQGQSQSLGPFAQEAGRGDRGRRLGDLRAGRVRGGRHPRGGGRGHRADRGDHRGHPGA